MWWRLRESKYLPGDIHLECAKFLLPKLAFGLKFLHFLSDIIALSARTDRLRAIY